LEAFEEELETIEESEDKGWTGFHTHEDQPFLYDYVIKGFFKDACSMLRRVKGKNGTLSSKLPAHKKVIDGLIFILPRRLMLDLHGQEQGTCERPLRAQTARGERVALARSHACPVGTTLTFTVSVLGVVTEDLLREWFEYGQLRGLGQWRNSGKGRFTAQMQRLTE
jgi:hypothetical protein